jgi:enamine deaminase RidA (YjgF/YER057c/UK114 family)
MPAPSGSATTTSALRLARRESRRLSRTERVETSKVLLDLHGTLGGEVVTRRLISSGSTFEKEIGYSRAVVDGEWVFVSGTTGFDYSTMTIPDGVIEQTEQCLKNIEAALVEAGSSLRDVVRVTYILPNGSEFSQCWPTLRKYFGEVRPAATMISAGLADPRMRIEIEVTARLR